MSDAAVRAAIVLLVSTFLDDGVRELQTFGDQCRYLESSANHILLPRPLSALYVIASMVVQLGGGSYLLASALLSPSALGLPVLGGWPHVRRCTAALVAFVLSSLLVYGLGQPASQHAQGRLVFLLRNGGILGGLLLLLAAQQTTAARRRGLRLLARVCLALHGLELAPADSMAIVWLVDMLCLPLTVALFAGLHTSRVALALAALLVASDLSLNHFWSGTRYNDNIRCKLRPRLGP